MANKKRLDLIDRNELMELYENTPDWNIDDLSVPVPVIRQNIKDMLPVDAVVLPCKIGDTVWAIKSFNGVILPQKGRVSEMYFTTDMQLRVVVFRTCRGEWGEDVFATKEEAETAIKKGWGKND